MTTVQEGPTSEQHDVDPFEENIGEAPLTILLGTRFTCGLKHFGVVALFGIFFVYLTYVPLFHTDLWDHVLYGHYILDHGELPQQDPALGLAQGVPVVCSMWLSQTIFALVETWGGPTQLSTLYAVTVLATYLVLFGVFYYQSRRLSLAVIGIVAVFSVVGWNRQVIIRPEMFGGLAFAILLALLVKTDDTQDPLPQGAGWREWLSAERSRWSLWLGVPILFALWANLHGSYMCGLVVLGCYFVGRVIEVAWRERTLEGVVEDGWVRRWLVLGELALLASFLNPYGVDLFLHNLLFAGNENLLQVLEWDPLVIASVGGIGFVITWLLLLVALRASDSPLRPFQVLLVLVFTAAALKHFRMLTWYAPVITFVIIPHVTALYNRLFPSIPLEYVSPIDVGDVPPLRRRNWSFALCCLGMIWISFAMSSFYYPLITGTERDPESLYSQQTPREMTAWLREYQPEGQIWNTQMWGGWIAWDGRSEDGKSPEVFMTSNIHVAPPTVWKDYLKVFSATADWEQILDRYHVDTVIVDKELQPELTTLVRRSPSWRSEYEDDLALVVARVPNRKPGAEEDVLPDWLTIPPVEEVTP